MRIFQKKSSARGMVTVFDTPDQALEIANDTIRLGSG